MTTSKDIEPDQVIQYILKEAHQTIDALHSSVCENKPLKPSQRKSVNLLLDKVIAISRDSNEAKFPIFSFDPADPEILAKLVIIALVAQPRELLESLEPVFGSGVYAIYYHGDHPLYKKISNTETPIYVGKADPDSPFAKSPKEQGLKLFNRLKDHRKSIEKAEKFEGTPPFDSRLFIKDFSIRRLVCSTNSQLVAEKHLINLFQPVWNSEVKVCWGVSKHGDSAKTRANNRSPWDVVHPGRAWAMSKELNDSKKPTEIQVNIEKHLNSHKIYESRSDVIEDIVISMCQHSKDPENN